MHFERWEILLLACKGNRKDEHIAHCLSVPGIHKSVTEIIEKSGLSKTTFYRHIKKLGERVAKLEKE